jgi:hypothetical protein
MSVPVIRTVSPALALVVKQACWRVEKIPVPPSWSRIFVFAKLCTANTIRKTAGSKMCRRWVLTNGAGLFIIKILKVAVDTCTQLSEGINLVIAQKTGSVMKSKYNLLLSIKTGYTC